MISKLLAAIPPTAVQFTLVLALSFLVGLERESLKRDGRRTFGGVRTFPLLGLLGFGITLLAKGNIFATLTGFAVMASFMLVSYWFKLRNSMDTGITTEMSGLVVYVMGALVFHGNTWLACTLVVVNLFLLELRDSLEGLADRISTDEIVAATKFLLLTAVILPLVPNKGFTDFQINPYKTWLVVVAVSVVSYGSYILNRVAKGRGGVLLSAILGGAYSSTVTTVVLAKQAAVGSRPFTFTGSILAASGMMYLRVLILVLLFNRELGRMLAPSFVVLAALSLGLGTLMARHRTVEASRGEAADLERNPLDLRAALTFAALFLVVVVVTQLAVRTLGHRGIYSLAGLMGLTDITPFIMSMTQAAGAATPLKAAAASILIVTASNSVVRGVYAYMFAKRTTGKWCLWSLSALGLLGLVPLIWLGL